MLGTVFTWRCSLPLGGDVSFGEIQQMGMLWFRLTAHVFGLDRFRGTSDDFGSQNSSAKHWKGRETWRWKGVLEVHMKGFQERFWNCTNSVYSYLFKWCGSKINEKEIWMGIPSGGWDQYMSSACGLPLDTTTTSWTPRTTSWTAGTDMDTRNNPLDTPLLTDVCGNQVSAIVAEAF